MSSLLDDLNARAYASADRRTCHCDSCDAKPEPACRWCGDDCIPLNDLDECQRCAPTETETCAEHEARMREVRK